MEDANRKFERVLATYAPSLSRLAASYESRPALREELLQDIAFALWRALPSFRGESSEKTFVMRIATNRALSHLASQKGVRHQFCDSEMVSDTFLQAAEPGPGPDEVTAQMERAARLQQAVRELPLPLRQVLVLAFEGLSHEEIARVLGLTAGNVAVRLHRGKGLLRQVLGEAT